MFTALPLADGSYFQLRHLPWAVVEELEAEYGTSWSVIVDMPQVNGAILVRLAQAVATLHGETLPEVDTVEDLIAISDSVKLVDGDGVPVVQEADEPIAWSSD